MKMTRIGTCFANFWISFIRDLYNNYSI